MKIKLILIVAFFAIFTFTSCEDNPLEGTFVDESGVGDIGITGTGGGSGTSTGDYHPRAVGNTWTYNVSTGGTETQEMTSTINDGGKVYYNMAQSTALTSGNVGVAKQAASYFLRTDVVVSANGYDVAPTQPIYVKELQDDAAVGITWENPVTATYTYTPTAGGAAIPNVVLNYNYKYTMVERDMTKIVNGQTYTNVLHVSLLLEVTGSPDTLGDYYFAKDVGIIEYSVGATVNTLTSYTLN